jgi:hypothetical protein
VSIIAISHMYDEIIAKTVERAYEAGYARGYQAGKLGLYEKESAETTPSPSCRPPQNPRA